MQLGLSRDTLLSCGAFAQLDKVLLKLLNGVHETIAHALECGGVVRHDVPRGLERLRFCLMPAAHRLLQPTGTVDCELVRVDEADVLALLM